MNGIILYIAVFLLFFNLPSLADTYTKNNSASVGQVIEDGNHVSVSAGNVIITHGEDSDITIEVDCSEQDCADSGDITASAVVNGHSKEVRVHNSRVRVKVFHEKQEDTGNKDKSKNKNKKDFFDNDPFFKD
ncbi:hypothetical protein [Candidatus Venteria ishoeyi]|uniref:Uncharacterized protein n=1 Tax=Candidatus Venteria ishoeyi TaxID=1899563 RepID=A0A1H6F474_9GAMM|nr:hypothetical protein [Candidatus Venteria ishoeyi]SEH04892.1 Uncharacterised protein [Candidatus Venteria ishoeyi]